MSALTGYKSDFKNLIDEFKTDYPEISKSKIEEILEMRLFDLFKEHIINLNIPEDITIRNLKVMRGKIRIIQKSHRYERKIDSIIKKFNRNRQYLKLKGIQDNLKAWEGFSKNNNLNFLTNGTSLRYNNETFFEFNGNKNMGTSISYREFRKNQNQYEFKKDHINEGSYEVLKPEFDTAFEFYEDYITDYEKINIVKQKEMNPKIPIELDLLERIKNIQSEPMKKKYSKNLSILDLSKKLDELYDD